MLGDSIVVSATEPTGDNRKKVWFQKGKNLFDKNDVRYGYELNGGNGSVVKNELDFVSDYIKVYPGQKLYKSGARAGTSNCFYDENKNFISTVRLVSGVISVPTANSISYMRINGVLTDLDSIQITSGDTQLAYEAYIEPKIFIKNDNNIYEEFTKKQEENYSEQEQIIGTWIDGKPLYRITIPNIAVGANKQVAVDLSKYNYNEIWIDNGNSFNHYADSNLTSSSVNWINTSYEDSGLIWINQNKTMNVKNHSTSDRTYFITLKYTKS